MRAACKEFQIIRKSDSILKSNWDLIVTVRIVMYVNAMPVLGMTGN